VYFRAGELARDDEGELIRIENNGLLASARVIIVDADTGEQIGSAYEADTKKGYVSCFKIDEEGRCVREPRTSPEGEVAWDMVILRKRMNFDVVRRDTGKVISEYRLDSRQKD
jgi:hypothetical protein